MLFRSAQAQVIEDLKFQCKIWFSACIISTCRRSANHTAHGFAKFGVSCRMYEPKYWEYEVPACISGIVMGDLAQTAE